MICDSHNDILTSKLSYKRIIDYIKSLHNSSVKSVTAAIWTTALKDPIIIIKTLYSHFPKTIKVRVGFANEDAWFVTEDNINEVCSYPLDYIGLTWNKNNNLAGGALDDGELSELGIKLLATADKNNIPIDTAHLNLTSFYQVLENASGRILNSHCAFSSVHQHPRNLDDSQIKLLISRGAYIGLNFVGDFLCDKKISDSDDVVRHIDYFASKFGIDNLGLGTDFFGTDNLPRDIKDYKTTSIIVEKLLKLGYNENEIDNIFCNNYLRFFGVS